MSIILKQGAVTITQPDGSSASLDVVVDQTRDRAIAEIEAKKDEVLASIPDDYSQLSESIDALNEVVGIAAETIVPDMISGGYYNRQYNSFVASQNHSHSDLIPVTAGTDIIICTAIGNANYGWNFYDDSKEFKNGDTDWITDEFVTRERTVHIPNGISYIRIHKYNGATGDVYIKQSSGESRVEKNEQAIEAINADIYRLKNPDWAASDRRQKMPVFVAEATIRKEAWNGNGGVVSAGRFRDNINEGRERDCIQFVSTNNGRVTASLSATVDASVNPVLLMLNQHREDNAADYQALQLELYSGGTFDQYHRAEYQLMWSDGTESWASQYVRLGELYTCQVMDARGMMNIGASFDIHNVTGIGFHLFHNSGTTRGLDIVRAGFIEPLQRGGCAIVVDNFNAAVPDMCDYAYSKGIRLNVSCIPYFIDHHAETGTGSEEELKRVALQGHCIINHTFSHNPSPDLTNVEVFDEIVDAIHWMDARGYTVGSGIVSVPSATLPTDKADAFLNSGADTVFHSWLPGKKYKTIVPVYPTTRMLDISVLDNNPPTAAAADAVANDCITAAQTAIANKGICVIGFHGTFWQADNGTAWKKLIDALADMDELHTYGIDDIINGRFL